MTWAWVAIVISVVAFVVAAYFYRWVEALPTAEGPLADIGKLIRKGAFTFLKRNTGSWPSLWVLYPY